MTEEQNQSFPEPDQSEADDWLAGATVEAQVQDLEFGGLDVSFDGLDLPDPPDLVA